MLIHTEVTEKIIKAFYDVYNELGAGFLEAVYEKALLIALKQAGLSAIAQKPLKVYFRNEIVGDYVADNKLPQGYRDRSWFVVEFWRKTGV